MVVIIVIVAAAAVGAIFWWQKHNKQNDISKYWDYINYKLGKMACVQVVAPFRNAKTGECKIYPTPCDVPPWLGSEWIGDQDCLKF